MPLWRVKLSDKSGQAEYTSTSASERAAATKVLRDRYPDGTLAGAVTLEVAVAQEGLIKEEPAMPAAEPELSDAAE